MAGKDLRFVLGFVFFFLFLKSNVNLSVFLKKLLCLGRLRGITPKFKGQKTSDM